MVALEDAHDVLDGLAHVDPDLVAAGVHRVAAELDDGHLHRVAGAQRRLLEDQGDALAVQRPAELGRRDGGEVEDLAQLVGREVGDVEEVPGHQSAAPIIATASSISASDTVSGGATRSAVGVTALVTRPAASRRR